MVDDNASQKKELREQTEMQLALSRTLLYGVLLSVGIVIIGLILMIITNSTGYACDSVGNTLSCIIQFNSNSNVSQLYPASFGAVVSGVMQAKPFAVIQLGAIVLLATPVLRVVTSLVLFGLERDRSFVLITLFVLGVLLFSFFLVPAIPIFKA
jgi:uncharacterized membrane protein